MNNQEIIDAVNKWQSYPLVHPLTCGIDSSHGLLEPRERAGRVLLFCPDCPYMQVDIPEPVLKFRPPVTDEDLEELGLKFTCF